MVNQFLDAKNKRDKSFDMTRKLFPHQVGHFIGLDVHDTLGIPLSHDLRPGQVISIEPGLYIPDEDIYPEKYRGIGKVHQILRVTSPAHLFI